MSAKTIEIAKLPDLLAEGPTGRAKIDKQAREIRELSETLDLMARRQRPYDVPVQNADNAIRFGLIADTHIGSLYQRTDALRAYYAHCEREGIETILHVGDVLDGWKVYPGHLFELHPNARSWGEQRDMFADLAPRVKGITTHFITGNHDNSFKKEIGLVPGPEIAAVRSDWKFVGQDIGTVTLKAKGGFSFRVMLVHPDGGTAYATSYRLQRMIESISGGQKPDMVAEGHFHKSLTLPNYRNVYGMESGSFVSQTPYMARKGISAMVGGWIVTVTMNDRKKLTTRINTEWIGFFEPQA
jgi:DNA repair exonuclease SbcCD nuclease subunit